MRHHRIFGVLCRLMKDSRDGLSLVLDRPMVIDDIIIKDELRFVTDRDWLPSADRPQLVWLASAELPRRSESEYVA